MGRRFVVLLLLLAASAVADDGCGANCRLAAHADALRDLSRLPLEALIDFPPTCACVYDRLDLRIRQFLLHSSPPFVTVCRMLTAVDHSRGRRRRSDRVLWGMPPQLLVTLVDQVVHRPDLFAALLDSFSDKARRSLIWARSWPLRRLPRGEFLPAGQHDAALFRRHFPLVDEWPDVLDNGAYDVDSELSWVLREGVSLAEPADVLDLVGAGMRFALVPFLRQVDVPEERLGDVFPLLDGVWTYDCLRRPRLAPARALFGALVALREDRPGVVAALLRLPRVADMLRAGVPDLVAGFTTAADLRALLTLDDAFGDDLLAREFGPDGDRLLHLVCRRGQLDLVGVVVEQVAERNGRDRLPVRYLPWDRMAALAADFPDAAAALFASDASALGAAIAADGLDAFLQRTDFVAHVLGEYDVRHMVDEAEGRVRLRPGAALSTARALLVRYVRRLVAACADWPTDDVRALQFAVHHHADVVVAVVNAPDHWNCDTVLHKAFMDDDPETVVLLLGLDGVDMTVRNAANRVPFRYVSERTLCALLDDLSAAAMAALVRSDPFAFLQAATTILREKRDWRRVKAVLDNVDLFGVCLESAPRPEPEDVSLAERLAAWLPCVRT